MHPATRETPVKQRAERGMIALKLAGCYARINMAPKAVAAYRNAARFGNISAEDRLLFARQLLKNGLYREAAEVFGNVLDSLSDNELAHDIPFGGWMCLIRVRLIIHPCLAAIAMTDCISLLHVVRLRVRSSAELRVLRRAIFSFRKRMIGVYGASRGLLTGE